MSNPKSMRCRDQDQSVAEIIEQLGHESTIESKLFDCLLSESCKTRYLAWTALSALQTVDSLSYDSFTIEATTLKADIYRYSLPTKHVNNTKQTNKTQNQQNQQSREQQTKQRQQNQQPQQQQQQQQNNKNKHDNTKTT